MPAFPCSLVRTPSPGRHILFLKYSHVILGVFLYMKAEKKKIKKEKIMKGLTTSAGAMAGVTVGMAMMFVSDPFTATATGMGASAATIQLIDFARDVRHGRNVAKDSCHEHRS